MHHLNALAVMTLVVGLLVARVQGKAIEPCGPGDGPQPLVDITPVFGTKVRLLPSPTDGQAISLLEPQRQAWIQTTSGEIWEQELQSAGATKWVTDQSLPISRVISSNARFGLASDNHGLTHPEAGLKLFDRLLGKQWTQIETQPSTPLYWYRNSLYYVTTTSVAQTKILRAYQYDEEKQTRNRSCELELDNSWTLSKGHSYPLAFFHRNSIFKSRNYTQQAQWNLEDCTVQLSLLPQGQNGPVHELYQFVETKSLVAIIEGNNSSLLYQTPRSCTLIETPNVFAVTSAGNRSQPLFMQFSKENGAYLVFVEQLQKARILANLPIVELDEKRVQLSQDGQTIYLMPKLANGSTPLIEITMTR